MSRRKVLTKAGARHAGGRATTALVDAVKRSPDRAAAAEVLMWALHQLHGVTPSGTLRDAIAFAHRQAVEIVFPGHFRTVPMRDAFPGLTKHPLTGEEIGLPRRPADAPAGFKSAPQLATTEASP